MAGENQEQKKIRKAGGIVRTVIIVILLAVAVISAVQLIRIYTGYKESADVFKQYDELYKPDTDSSGASVVYSDNTDNDSIISMQSTYPDVCGWLTIGGTKVDYVYAQSADNDYYLHRSLDGEYIYSGTLFLDYRCSRDFSAFNTIVYGHNMKDNSMFGELEKFADGDFFSSHTTGTVYLPHATYKLEIFAYLVVEDDDAVIYNAAINDDAGKSEFLDYVKANARQYSDIGVTGSDAVLTLSTCSYQFSDARSILVARVVK